MKIKYSIVSLALISILAVSCGKKMLRQKEKRNQKQNRQKKVTKKLRKLLLN
jgi:membrane protein implicated in regulation of membrane protease activity